MSNNRPDSSRGSQQPNNGGSKGHRDGMKHPAHPDAQRGSIGTTELDQRRGNETIPVTPGKDKPKADGNALPTTDK